MPAARPGVSPPGRARRARRRVPMTFRPFAQGSFRLDGSSLQGACASIGSCTTSSRSNLAGSFGGRAGRGCPSTDGQAGRGAGLRRHLSGATGPASGRGGVSALPPARRAAQLPVGPRLLAPTAAQRQDRPLPIVVPLTLAGRAAQGPQLFRSEHPCADGVRPQAPRGDALPADVTDRAGQDRSTLAAVDRCGCVAATSDATRRPISVMLQANRAYRVRSASSRRSRHTVRA